jgi:hypothetical protein
MRLAALFAATVLAAIAWMACWQEVQLVRLRQQMRAATVASEPARPQAALDLAPLDPAALNASELNPAELEHSRSKNALHALPSMDRLRTLFAERERAVADARDAAAQFGIPVGPEMDQAIAFSTADLDQAIAKLIGPEAAAQLALATEPSVPVAPLTPAPVAPAPIYVNVAPAPVYVTMAAPAPVVSAAASSEDGGVEDEGTYPVATGGLGWGYITSGRTQRHKETQLEQLQSLTASAGIPLEASPLGGVVSTSPLLLLRQHMGAAR